MKIFWLTAAAVFVPGLGLIAGLVTYAWFSGKVHRANR